MTYTHLTTNELVMIEAYYQENIKVSDIVTSLGRSKQTIYNVINYLKEGHSAYDYYNRYKINKKRCGRNKTSLTQSEKDFIQTQLEKNWSLDVIKGTYPDRVSCSMRTLYRLADRGILKKEDFPWKGKRKPNGHSEKQVILRLPLINGCLKSPAISLSRSLLISEKNFLIGNLFRMYMTLIFSLRIQDVLSNEVSLNILMAY